MFDILKVNVYTNHIRYADMKIAAQVCPCRLIILFGRSIVKMNVSLYPFLRILHQENALYMRGQERFLPPSISISIERVPIPLSSLHAFGNDGSAKNHSHKSILVHNREP